MAKEIARFCVAGEAFGVMRERLSGQFLAALRVKGIINAANRLLRHDQGFRIKFFDQVILALVMLDDAFVVIALSAETVVAHAGMAAGPLHQGRPYAFIKLVILVEDRLMIATLKDHPFLVARFEHAPGTNLRREIDVIESERLEPP